MNIRGTKTQWLRLSGGWFHLPLFWRWRLSQRSFTTFQQLSYKISLNAILFLASFLSFLRGYWY